VRSFQKEKKFHFLFLFLLNFSPLIFLFFLNFKVVFSKFIWFSDNFCLSVGGGTPTTAVFHVKTGYKPLSVFPPTTFNRRGAKIVRELFILTETIICW
jgi:hypothetical protein